MSASVPSSNDGERQRANTRHIVPSNLDLGAGSGKDPLTAAVSGDLLRRRFPIHGRRRRRRDGRERGTGMHASCLPWAQIVLQALSLGGLLDLVTVDGATDSSGGNRL